MKVLIALIFVASIQASSAQENLCAVSYLQNKIQIDPSDFTAEKMISTEHGELFVDQRRVGFDESFDLEIGEKLKSKGYELLTDLKGNIELRKFEVSLSNETFKEHLFIQFALRSPLPGIENVEQKSTIGMMEQLSQKKQAHDVVTFLDKIPSCEELKQSAAIALKQKQIQDEKAKNEKAALLDSIKNSFGGYDGLNSLFESLSTDRDTSGYLGDWKPVAKAHLDESTGESTFSEIAFDGEPNFHMQKEHVEKNKLNVDIGCPGGYVDFEFKEGEIVFQYYCNGPSWIYNHCKYDVKDDSMICNQKDESFHHSYVIYHRYDPFKN